MRKRIKNAVTPKLIFRLKKRKKGAKECEKQAQLSRPCQRQLAGRYLSSDSAKRPEEAVAVLTSKGCSGSQKKIASAPGCRLSITDDDPLWRDHLAWGGSLSPLSRRHLLARLARPPIPGIQGNFKRE